jgi:hypothetical protein
MLACHFACHVLTRCTSCILVLPLLHQCTAVLAAFLLHYGWFIVATGIMLSLLRVLLNAVSD